MTVRCLLVWTLVAASVPAHAYIGPGLGAGLFAVVGALFGVLALGFASTVWYPLKRAIRRRRDTAEPEGSDDQAVPEEPGEKG